MIGSASSPPRPRALNTNPCILAALLAATCVLGCEHERKPPPTHNPDADVEVVKWSAPESAPHLLDTAAKERSLTLGGTRRFPQCWEILGNAGDPAQEFPLKDGLERALAFASCDLEAYTQLDDGTWLLAWGTAEEEGSRARDLRLGAWGPDGELKWWKELDRSGQSPNWVANFRRSFIVPLPPKHVCYGTLWEGDTQVSCVGLEDGEERWTGSLPFWTGMQPQPGGDGLLVADLTALTKRYPFSGAEMKYRKLEGLGGRAGYYATDGARLYFAPSRTEKPNLVAYDLQSFEPIWKTPLPTTPAPSFSHAFDAFDLLLLKLDETMYGLDTETGAVRWAYEIGDDVPSVAALGDRLYILCRRPDDPNTLFALDPKTGEALWHAATPAGTLRVESIGGHLILGSVRAVQPVEDLPDGHGGE